MPSSANVAQSEIYHLLTPSQDISVSLVSLWDGRISLTTHLRASEGI